MDLTCGNSAIATLVAAMGVIPLGFTLRACTAHPIIYIVIGICVVFVNIATMVAFADCGASDSTMAVATAIVPIGISAAGILAAAAAGSLQARRIPAYHCAAGLLPLFAATGAIFASAEALTHTTILSSTAQVVVLSATIFGVINTALALALAECTTSEEASLLGETVRTGTSLLACLAAFAAAVYLWLIGTCVAVMGVMYAGAGVTMGTPMGIDCADADTMIVAGVCISMAIGASIGAFSSGPGAYVVAVVLAEIAGSFVMPNPEVACAHINPRNMFACITMVLGIAGTRLAASASQLSIVFCLGIAAVIYASTGIPFAIEAFSSYTQKYIIVAAIALLADASMMFALSEITWREAERGQHAARGHYAKCRLTRGRYATASGVASIGLIIITTMAMAIGLQI